MLQRSMLLLSLCLFLVILMSSIVFPADFEDDPRITMMQDSNNFDARIEPVSSQSEWESRKTIMRETLMLRSGLWPEPARTPLNAKVFDEKQGDGFTVAKVYYESLPGLYSTGNLYVPSEGSGPFPAIITPHGHWGFGRLENSESGSIPGRCIDFARMGFVVFSIDMVGYNDSFQLPHDPNKSRAQLNGDVPLPYEHREHRGDFDYPEANLYGFNLGGVQVWNAIRGVDFLCGLPNVDPERIGATGASGGASQTIFLMIADERIKVAAPVNIIGAKRHPGCRCENMPGLWLDMTTIELSAAFSPKPLLLMSATEDPWTAEMPTREYPMIQKYYSLYDAEDNVKNVHITAGHNYNADTRAAVYDWFVKHLNPSATPIRNPNPVATELKSLGDLRVFPDRILPENALTERAIIANWKKSSEAQIADIFPTNAVGMDRFSDEAGKMLRRALVLNRDLTSIKALRMAKAIKMTKGFENGLNFDTMEIGFPGDEPSRCKMEMLAPKSVTKGSILVVRPDDEGFFEADGSLSGWAKTLTGRGYRLYRVRGHASGERSIPAKITDSFPWSDTYNLCNVYWSVHDVAAAMSYIKKENARDKLTVLGLDDCGLAASFAAAAVGNADKVMIDLDGRDPFYDGALVKYFPIPAIKRIGDFRTAMLLLMRHDITIFNAGPTFDSDWCLSIANKTGLSENLTLMQKQKGSEYLDYLK